MSTARGALLGSAAGLAWAGALRGWMVLLVGPASVLTWRTPAYVRAPGAALTAAGIATMTGMGAMAAPLTTRKGMATALLGGALMTTLCVATSTARRGRDS